MAAIKRIPQVALQAFLNGGSVTGVAPAGAPVVDSNETIFRGQYRKWEGCTDGGLFLFPSADCLNASWRLERLIWNLPGSGGVTISIVDDDGMTYELATVAADEGQWFPEENHGLLLLPDWGVIVVAGAGLTGDGRLVAFAAPGWRTDAFEARILGEEAYPPPKQ